MEGVDTLPAPNVMSVLVKRDLGEHLISAIKTSVNRVSVDNG